MAASPTERTLKWLREQGIACEVVEKWMPRTRQRKDLFGGIDIVGIRADPQLTVGVQATSGGHVSDRVKKIVEIPELRTWVEAGNQLWVVGWRLAGKKGQRKTWQPRVVEIGF